MGCRVVVDGLKRQDEVVSALLEEFPDHVVDDRREHDQDGYRAVHVVVRLGRGTTVEVQVRTEPQNFWANVCELLADRLDPAFKYGGGDETLRGALRSYSDAVFESETITATYGEGITELDALLDRLEELGVNAANVRAPLPPVVGPLIHRLLELDPFRAPWERRVELLRVETECLRTIRNALPALESDKQ